MQSIHEAIVAAAVRRNGSALVTGMLVQAFTTVTVWPAGTTTLGTTNATH